MLAVLLAADTVAFFLIVVLFPFWVAAGDFSFSFFSPGDGFVSIGDTFIYVLGTLFGRSPSSIGVDVPCCGALADRPGSSVEAFRLRVTCLPGFSCWAVAFAVFLGL